MCTHTRILYGIDGVRPAGDLMKLVCMHRPGPDNNPPDDPTSTTTASQSKLVWTPLEYAPLLMWTCCGPPLKKLPHEMRPKDVVVLWLLNKHTRSGV